MCVWKINDNSILYLPTLMAFDISTNGCNRTIKQYPILFYVQKPLFLVYKTNYLSW